MGTALHLHCGPRRFVLGGRDRRIAAGTRLDAPDAGYGLPVDIDAWLSAPEFEQILTMVGRQSGLDASPPAPGGPTRCLLFPNPLLIQEMGALAVTKKREFLESAGQPRLAIDVGADCDPGDRPDEQCAHRRGVAGAGDRDTGDLPSSILQALVPNGRKCHQPCGHRITGPRRQACACPFLVCAPLTIGCRDSASGLDFRFSWPDNVATENARADYEVSGTDWLTLVEKSAWLRISRGAGESDGLPRRWSDRVHGTSGAWRKFDRLRSWK